MNPAHFRNPSLLLDGSLSASMALQQFVTCDDPTSPSPVSDASADSTVSALDLEKAVASLTPAKIPTLLTVIPG